MARTRRRAAPELSLFPFLSVLAAVMGALVLVISGMSRLALANPAQVIELSPAKATEKSPRYVECRREGLLVYPVNVGKAASGEPRFIKKSEITSPDGPWTALLEGLEGSSTQYLLFLVRPNALDVFEAALDEVDTSRLDVGYDPVIGTGRLFFDAKGGKP